MIGWITKLIPAPYRIGVALAAVGFIAVGSGVAGWKARDYFADRKELRDAKAQNVQLVKEMEGWKSAAEGWEKAVVAQTEKAAQFAAERAESQARADKLSQDILKYRDRLTRMEKVDEATGTCERTDPCHWLLFNAAVSGTEAPSQCAASGSVQD